MTIPLPIEGKPTRMPRLKLIAREPRRYHVSQDTVHEFEGVIAQDSRAVSRVQTQGLLSAVPSRIWDLLTATSCHSVRDSTVPSFESCGRRDSFYFSVMMGLNIRKMMPEALLRGRKSVYLFDAWPASHDRICNFANAFGVEYLFISSRQAARQLGGRLMNTSCEWVPEGIAPENYHFRPPTEKDIDVLQLGRRYDSYHGRIASILEYNGRSYLYEKGALKIVFSTREAYLDGLARSKISICVPANRTHPKRAGEVETMTARYLQSIASKCLLVGHAPTEMIDLFGYNPVIEIDRQRPGEQLLDLLKDYDAYQPLIEKNYSLVREHHGWRNRWEKIAQFLFAA